MKIVFIVNVDWFFISHRLPIALEAIQQGHEVHLIAGDTGKIEKLKEVGIKIWPINLDRGSVNPFKTFILLLNLVTILKNIKPDIVHLVTIKPVLIGGIASLVSNVKSIVYAISGLGYVFTNQSIKARIIRFFIIPLYRIALSSKNKMIIFQNNDDKKILEQYTKIKNQQITLIPGSGVDLSVFEPSNLPKSVPIVLMACRLLIDKGIREFYQAALILQDLPARFVLVGSTDPDNPSSIPDGELKQWVAEGKIEWWGHKSNMSEILSQAYVVVLPSYREGMPKVLLEAQALGRPVVTTDVPGCRDAIKPNETGFLVPVKDAESLAQAIKKLLDDPDISQIMGHAARNFAVKNFDLRNVISTHLDIYQSLKDSQ